MRTKIIAVVILISLLSQSCADKFGKETKLFQTYLNDVFHEKIPENKHIYLLLAQMRCAGCVEQSLIKIAGKISIRKNPEVTVLTFDKTLVPDTLSKKAKVLLDRNSGYETIQSIANVALIRTERGKICEIKILNLNDTDKIIGEEF